MNNLHKFCHRKSLIKQCRTLLNFYSIISIQGSSSKKELQLFNRVNIPIQDILSWARGSTALIQSLLCYLITLGQNSLRYITTSSKSLFKLLLDWFTLKGFIKKRPSADTYKIVCLWEFFRNLKVEKSLNLLCFTVSFIQRAASPCNSKLACFVRKLIPHIYIRIKLITLQRTLCSHV